MRDEKLKELLNNLGDFTAEPVRTGLEDEIRRQIPYRLVRHRVTWNSFRIMIDLRLSRSVAAAVIIISISLWASLLAAWHTSADQIFADGKLLIKYSIAGQNAERQDTLASMEAFSRQLADRGADVTYYGETADPDNPYALLMHWRLPDGRYRVIFNDLSSKTVSPAVVITLQAYMLNQQPEK
ncbi:MAG: hypothetical protein JW720_03595 [Sedimentisphaerales bacterium]|nr:hypothetical protein [Sedimentisphaerales bacterium]